MSFHSFYWEGRTPEEPALDQALAELISPEGAYLQAFATLLHSGNAVAQGIALDHFQYSGALSRFGGESALERFAPGALTVARKLLGDAPEGASHASALNAMMNVAQPEDADLIADALAQARDANVRLAGCTAAGAALWSSDEPSGRLLDVLAGLAFDQDLDVRERAEAVSAVGDADCPQAVALLVRAVESPELELQVQAAQELTTRGRLPAHRELLERVADSWPEDAGYLGAEVRRALTGFHSRHWTDRELQDSELRRAHEVLQFGYDRDAFQTLLHSNDPMAVGVALDHFKNAEDWDVDEEPVLRRAYAVLREPAVPPDAANHLSALDVVAADVADPELVIDLLETTQSTTVREKALWAANHVLHQALDQRLIDAVGRLADDPEHRTTALRVLAGAAGPAADPVLVRAFDSDDPAIRLEAAWQLAQPDRIDRHHDLLTRALDNLPTDSNRSRLLVTQIRKRLLP